jgi:hypothetical protein
MVVIGSGSSRQGQLAPTTTDIRQRPSIARRRASIVTDLFAENPARVSGSMIRRDHIAGRPAALDAANFTAPSQSKRHDIDQANTDHRQKSVYNARFSAHSFCRSF